MLLSANLAMWLILEASIDLAENRNSALQLVQFITFRPWKGRPPPLALIAPTARLAVLAVNGKSQRMMYNNNVSAATSDSYCRSSDKRSSTS